MHVISHIETKPHSVTRTTMLPPVGDAAMAPTRITQHCLMSGFASSTITSSEKAVTVAM